MIIKFRMIDKTCKEEWNEVVKESPTSEIFHLFEYGEIIEKTYGVQVFRFAAEVNGKLVAVLPMVHFATPFFGRKVVSLPFADVGGFCSVSNDDAVSRGLVKELVNAAKRLDADFIEVRSFRENASHLVDMGFSEGFQAFSYWLDATKPYDEVWMKYNKKIRHNIRKMKELGLEIKEAQHESDIREYYRTYLGRMKDFGTPPAPLAYWKNMWDTFHPNGMMKLIFTILGKRPIAGFVALLFKKKLYFVLNVSSKKFWKYHGLNELLFDWYIQYACNNGYDTVDFGRTREGTGVQKFKEKGWGVERIPLCTYYLFLHKKIRNPLETALDTESNMYTKVWRKFVPLPLTPTLGRLVRKSVGDV